MEYLRTLEMKEEMHKEINEERHEEKNEQKKGKDFLIRLAHPVGILFYLEFHPLYYKIFLAINLTSL